MEAGQLVQIYSLMFNSSEIIFNYCYVSCVVILQQLFVLANYLKKLSHIFYKPWKEVFCFFK